MNQYTQSLTLEGGLNGLDSRIAASGFQGRGRAVCACHGPEPSKTQSNRATSMRQIPTLRSKSCDPSARDNVIFASSDLSFSKPAAPRGRIASSESDELLSALHGLSFERNGFQVRIANGCDILKRQTAKLIERMYSARGLFPYGMHAEIDRRDITVVALHGNQAVATATIRMDYGNGLLADTLYSKEIDAVRSVGGRVCEVTQLAIDPERGSQDALAGVMQGVYVITRATRRVTDIFAEVNPRHASFHQRVFGFRRIGEERICPRVGAPAVLLHLPLAEFEERVARQERLHNAHGDRSHRLLPDHVDSRQLIEALSVRQA